MPQFSETTDTNVGWYHAEPYLNEKVRGFFKEYVGIGDERLHEHLVTFRDKAWNIRPFPCVGTWMFLRSTLDWISIHDEETVIIRRLQEGATMLDLGCAMAQTARYLAWRNAPTKNMVVSVWRHVFAEQWHCASDLLPGFYEASFDLFQDRETLQATFVQCDIFDPNSPLLKGYQSRFDIILAGDFLHQFNRADALAAACNIIRLSKPQAGSIILGKQIGRIFKEEENVNTTWGEGKSVMFHASPSSFEELWQEAQSETGTRWKMQIVGEEVGSGEWQPREAYEFIGSNQVGVKFVLTRDR